MTTEVYIWFNYKKPPGTSSSRIDWAGPIDVEEAKRALDRITADDMLKVQNIKLFHQDVSLSISMQEIKTGNVLYKRNVQ